jgi:hypothetical protein
MVSLTTRANLLFRQLVSIVGLLSILRLVPVDADGDTLSANVLAKYWIDSGDVLDHLDEYRALWIKVHGCV